MSITDNVVAAGEWIYDNGPMLLGLGMIVAFGYFCWIRSLRGMIVSGVGLVTTLLLGW